MLEAADKVGGAAVTDEFHPGLPQFGGELHRVAAPAQGHPRHGARAPRARRSCCARSTISCPAPKRSYLLSGRDGLTRAELARHAPSDGAAYDRYNAELNVVVPLIKKWIMKAPPEAGAGVRGLATLASLGRDLVGLSTDEVRIVHEFATKSAGDILDRFFEGDLAKSLFAFDGIVGNFASPYTPGTAYVLLHHLFGEAAGRAGRVGPCDRRDGVDHAGDGQGVPRGGGRYRAQCAGQRSAGRKGPRGRASSPMARRGRRARSRRRRSIPSCCSTG